MKSFSETDLRKGAFSHEETDNSEDGNGDEGGEYQTPGNSKHPRIDLHLFVHHNDCRGRVEENVEYEDALDEGVDIIIDIN